MTAVFYNTLINSFTNIKTSETMKRLITACAFTAILVAIMMVMPGSSVLRANTDGMMDQKKIIKFEELPEGAQKMIKTHFPQMEIALITEESELLNKSYTVVSDNKIKIEFNKKGEWEEIKCPDSEVPAAIVPQKITAYIKENFPGAKIISIETENNRGEYDVKLDSRISIEFNKNLEAVEIDL